MAWGAWQAQPPAAPADAAARVRAYHERTKHRRDRYARGPETIDWSSPPRPFRRFHGATVQALALSAGGLPPRRFDELGSAHAEAAPAPLEAEALGALLELSLALSAWKVQGPDRWALRCNPSSGNLHPIEAYAVTRGVAGLPDAVWHYDPARHALEQRCALHRPPQAAPALWLGLSSIAWREAWKYGERAFRYVQLDLGHALGALCHAAACLGWQARADGRGGSAALAHLLGLDRGEDFEGVETEEPEALLQLGPATALTQPTPWPQTAQAWQGRAERIDRHPMYRWPLIDEVAQATLLPASPAADEARASLQTAPSPGAQPAAPRGLPDIGRLAVDVIRGRRSAQAYTRRAVMPVASWQALAQAVQTGGLARGLGPEPARVEALALVHRVEGLAPGLYALERRSGAARSLREAFAPQAAWCPMEAITPGLHLLRSGEVGPTARLLSCAQAIAQDACVAWIFLGDVEGADLDQAPYRYRTLLREAGLLGQALYLNAEALGLRGTGVGCYFDDEVHALLGLRDARWQALYHFCVGEPLHDPRVQSHPPYDEARYRWRPADGLDPTWNDPCPAPA